MIILCGKLCSPKVTLWQSELYRSPILNILGWNLFLENLMRCCFYQFCCADAMNYHVEFSTRSNTSHGMFETNKFILTFEKWKDFVTLKTPMAHPLCLLTSYTFCEGKKGLLFEPYRQKQSTPSLYHGWVMRNQYFLYDIPLQPSLKLFHPFHVLNDAWLLFSKVRIAWHCDKPSYRKELRS